MDTRGRHVIAELDGCNADLLNDPARVRRLLLDAARVAHATALAVEVFEFANGGVSGFVLLAESHISIHTWPEHAYAAVDIYTCGRYTMPEQAGAYLAEGLEAGKIRISALDRGLASRDGGHEHRLLPPREGEPSTTMFAPTAA